MVVAGYRGDEYVYTRCFRSPVEVHHMLTRSRGGKILDAHGETMHLIALCNRHHRHAHSPEGRALMIDGYVVTEHGRPSYSGSHEGLKAKYGHSHEEREDRDLQGGVPGTSGEPGGS